MEENTQKDDAKKLAAFTAGAAVVGLFIHVRNRRIRRAHAVQAADYIGSMRAAYEIVKEKIDNGEYEGKTAGTMVDDFQFYHQIIQDKLS